ncbi:RNA polymerase I-specific transcription initiation factor RRN3 [Chelonus insularis]|uniref:RNA polymerase I-specific transcription initiation factor RRN3 n=1 Tax=Chelonus insularis TaxID=460826 RepID=UPI001589454E|nr:RNA polymerase I-specific transcription initiation factor RRN3 [Chelonus insularis]
MSVISTRSTSVASILKTPGLRKKIASQSNRVRFRLPDDLKSVLINYESGRETKPYEDLIYIVRDAPMKDSELIQLLTQVRQCISLLGPKQRIFIETLLKINWINRDLEATTAYKAFLEDLVCVHIYHCKLIIDRLVCLFRTISDENKEKWKDGKPPDEDISKLFHVHDVLFKFLKIVPMSYSILLQCLSSQFPYFKHNMQSHVVYVHSALKILDYAPELRLDILSLIINKLVVIDVNAPRSEIENHRNNLDDDDEVFKIESVNDKSSEQSREHPLALTLDMCMEKIFQFIHDTCYPNNALNMENVKKIYLELLQIFEKTILPTYASHHVQFIMFYICSVKTAVAEAFLNWLWHKVSNPNVPSIIRQSAVAYIASLLARANFIPIDLLTSLLQKMGKWIHSYIAAQDSLESANSDIRVHAVFYAVCQAVFYIIGFKHRDLVSTKKNLLFLQSLNFTKIISCQLNPLRVCLPVVVQHFATVTRTYQIAYCYTVIEHNSRSNLPVLQNSSRVTTPRLDTFFPFDPYILNESSHRISPLYLHYQGSMNVETSTGNNKEENDEDDFMDISYPQEQDSNNRKERFSYSTSPGFIHS